MFQNEEIIEAIYGAQWYLLREPERRCFTLMLHKSQNYTEMTIGGFAPLNLETFVAVRFLLERDVGWFHVKNFSNFR